MLVNMLQQQVAIDLHKYHKNVHILYVVCCVNVPLNSHVFIKWCMYWLSAVVEVVPQLNAVLSRMITQLGAIKHENMQWERPRTARDASPFRSPESITCWTCGHEDYSAANGRGVFSCSLQVRNPKSPEILNDCGSRREPIDSG